MVRPQRAPMSWPRWKELTPATGRASRGPNPSRRSPDTGSVQVTSVCPRVRSKSRCVLGDLTVPGTVRCCRLSTVVAAALGLAAASSVRSSAKAGSAWVAVRPATANIANRDSSPERVLRVVLIHSRPLAQRLSHPADFAFPRWTSRVLPTARQRARRYRLDRETAALIR